MAGLAVLGLALVALGMLAFTLVKIVIDPDCPDARLRQDLKALNRSIVAECQGVVRA